ncbi:MAG: CBS domain-containing protein [Phycisphaerae bacterium]
MHTVEAILKTKPERPVFSIKEDATVLEAANLMNAHRIGALVVLRNEEIVGIFTERDLLNRVVAAEKDSRSVRIRDVMTKPIACCTLATTREECRSVMRHKRIRHLPVVEDGNLIGMISIGDLLADAEAEQQETILYLHEYLYGER